jgi:hypothetical protein
MSEQKKVEMLNNPATPVPAKGLYDSRYEHDACGIGFVANIKGISILLMH